MFGSCNPKTETTEGTETAETVKTTLTHNFEPTQTDKYSITESSAEEFSQALKNVRHILIKDSANKKVNGEIRLSSIVFKDQVSKEDESSHITFDYIGHFKETNTSVIHVQFYEGSEIYLVNQTNKQLDTIWNIPKLSQDLNYYFNLSEEYGMEGVPNGFQIWKIKPDGTLLKHSELDQLVWVPKEFAWLDSQTVILKVISVDKYVQENQINENSTDLYYIKVRLK